MFTILVVDDDEQMQFFLREALERQGYAVVVKGSAEDALDSLKTDNFDLMLLDVRLPGMSGLAAVEEILKIDAKIPIIVMTAHGTRDMPMWGDLFKSLNRDTAAIRIEALAEYLKTMQQ